MMITRTSSILLGLTAAVLAGVGLGTSAATGGSGELAKMQHVK
jgi:hypothetical protein